MQVALCKWKKSAWDGPVLSAAKKEDSGVLKAAGRSPGFGFADSTAREKERDIPLHERDIEPEMGTNMALKEGTDSGGR